MLAVAATVGVQTGALSNPFTALSNPALNPINALASADLSFAALSGVPLGVGENISLTEDNRTADQIISDDLKGSVRREFPGQFLGKTLAEIKAAAAAGDRAAKNAKKLLTKDDFKKECK